MSDEQEFFYVALCFLHGEFYFREKPEDWEEMRCRHCNEQMLKGEFPKD